MTNFPSSRRGALRQMTSWSTSLAVAALLSSCQSNRDFLPATANPPFAPLVTGIPPPGPAPLQAPEARAELLKIERVRNECINGRRRLCGLVLQAGKDGLVVDSGYTDLLRQELSHSWVVPAGVAASRPANLMEENSPGSVCVGLVYVTALPRRPVVRPYDYVVLQAYPAGEYTYAPVQNVKRTIRRFSVELETAIQLNLPTAKK